MVSIVPRAPLFQIIPLNNRESEITSTNLGPSDINYLKVRVPDGTPSMHLLAVEVGGTVVNSVIGGNFFSRLSPILYFYLMLCLLQRKQRKGLPR